MSSLWHLQVEINALEGQRDAAQAQYQMYQETMAALTKQNHDLNCQASKWTEEASSARNQVLHWTGLLQG